MVVNRYYPGALFDMNKDRSKRCLVIKLLGNNELAPIGNSIIHFQSHYVDFCYGAQNVRVVFANRTYVPLQEWLDTDKKFLHRVIGFWGPSGTFLYIVIEKKFLL